MGKDHKQMQKHLMKNLFDGKTDDVEDGQSSDVHDRIDPTHLQELKMTGSLLDVVSVVQKGLDDQSTHAPASPGDEVLLVPTAHSECNIDKIELEQLQYK